METEERIQRLKTAIHKLVEELMNLEVQPDWFGENKISLIIGKDGVISKIIRPVRPREKVERLSQEESGQVKEVKKKLKVKRDSIYLLTLMDSLKGELDKLPQLDEQSRQEIAPFVLAIEKKLSNVVNQNQLGKVEDETKVIDVDGKRT